MGFMITRSAYNYLKRTIDRKIFYSRVFVDSKYLLFRVWTINQKLFSYAPAILFLAKWLKGRRNILKVIFYSAGVIAQGLNTNFVEMLSNYAQKFPRKRM
jgi:hypothetical protein